VANANERSEKFMRKEFFRMAPALCSRIRIDNVGPALKLEGQSGHGLPVRVDLLNRADPGSRS
jgi:hypothetical protein